MSTPAVTPRKMIKLTDRQLDQASETGEAAVKCPHCYHLTAVNAMAGQAFCQYCTRLFLISNYVH